MMANQPLEQLVSIGIATKNRWHDLKITLDKINQAGLGALPTLILDDASTSPAPADLQQLSLKNLTIKQFQESRGYIVRRNQLAQMMATKYYLSLDDDSYPVSGSLQAAVDFAESLENCFCLSFPIYNPVLEKCQNRSLQDQPYPVRFYIGCAHLLHLERFLALGGYCEALIHHGEEMDIAARAFQKGWACYHFPDFLVHHTFSHAGRNWHRMDYYGARNNVLWNDWFVPQERKVVKQSRTFLARIFHSMRFRRLGQIQGELAGLAEIQQYTEKRLNMSPELYQQWLSLPIS